ncbi:MAG: sortase B protein-sorting domain-containing protein [Candidatus Electrothrix sp. ATG2]|nr:sortase B protein-sorting domain-containing protein [Candidatus Electrothrix sp. ATG2]
MFARDPLFIRAIAKKSSDEASIFLYATNLFKKRIIVSWLG